MNSVSVERGDNLCLRRTVWITGLQAGDPAHGEFAPGGQRANGGGHRAGGDAAARPRVRHSCLGLFRLLWGMSWLPNHRLQPTAPSAIMRRRG